MSSVKNDEESEKSPIFVFFKSEDCFHFFFIILGWREELFIYLRDFLRR